MKKFFFTATLLTLLGATAATAQICVFSCVIKDPTNVVQQGLKLVELKNILKETRTLVSLAQEVRDAAKRVEREYGAFTRTADRLSRISAAQAGVVDQVITRLSGSDAISYRMDAAEWAGTFAMGRTSKGDHPPQAAHEYDRAMNARTMSTVTTTLATLQDHATSLEEISAKLDRLGVELERASTIEQKQAIQASIVLLRAQHRTLRGLLKTSSLSLSAAQQAVETDAAANAAARQAQEQAALQRFIDSMKN